MNGFLSQVIVFPARRTALFVSRSGDGAPPNIVGPFLSVLLGDAPDQPAPPVAAPEDEPDQP